jgi:uncharacterized membrane protein
VTDADDQRPGPDEGDVPHEMHRDEAVAVSVAAGSGREAADTTVASGPHDQVAEGTGGADGATPAESAAEEDAGSEMTGYRRRHLTPEEKEEMEEKVRKIEIAISYVLRIGVTVSVAILAVGLGLMFAHHGVYASITGSFSYHALTGPHSPFPHNFGPVFRGVARGEGRAVVVLGVLVLILTPILRVATGVISFIYEKDPPMTIVTSFVLFVLILSFVLAEL